MTNRRDRRPVSGVLLLDKPVGWTSNAALQAVKRLYQAQKAGHTGSLDPLASGLLPICLGEATKLSGLLLNADKAYRFTCRLGVTTATGDAEGEILVTRPVGPLSWEQVEAALRRFTGVIQQTPPMYSAVKRDGQPLYKLARQGIEVERAPREVTIHDLRLLRLDGAELECELRCSKGTYVRTLAADLGEALGCGAHVAELRRLWVDPFREPRMWTLDALEDLLAQAGERVLDACLLPIEAGMASWPQVRVSEAQAHRLGRGQGLRGPYKPAGQVAIVDEGGRGLGLGDVDAEGGLRPTRLFRWAAATQGGEPPAG